MKTKWIIPLALLSLLLISARPVKLLRFEVINKSGMNIAIQLTGRETEQFYYLPVAKGDSTQPTVRSFTLVPDTYSMQLFYLELHDPVYGNKCSSGGTQLEMDRSQRMVFLPCTDRVPNGGEPTQRKYGGVNRRRPPR